LKENECDIWTMLVIENLQPSRAFLRRSISCWSEGVE